MATLIAFIVCGFAGIVSMRYWTHLRSLPGAAAVSMLGPMVTDAVLWVCDLPATGLTIPRVLGSLLGGTVAALIHVCQQKRARAIAAEQAKNAEVEATLQREAARDKAFSAALEKQQI